MRRGKRTWLVLVGIFLLSGCAPVDIVRTPSTALSKEAAANTYLGAWAEQAGVVHGQNSGFTLVDDGQDAFALRASLADHAQRALDVQTYILEDDRTGRALLKQMLHAAQRGVRVRLLLDDTASIGKQALLSAFDSHPNIEVRVFNPVPLGRSTWLTYHLALVADFDRRHRRMHNKLWVTDNAVAITGGRNLGDEYFDVADQINFNDLDVMAIGPVVETLSGSFDSYWNHPLAVPLRQFAQPKKDAWQALLVSLSDAARQSGALFIRPVSQRLVGEPGQALLDSLVWAPAIAIWDSPEKLNTEGYPPFETTLMSQLETAFLQLDQDFLIVSPYVVPTAAGVAFHRQLAQRGITVTILTNALEATDLPSLHGAYVPWRPELLKNGARLYELRAKPAQQPSRLAGEISSLHTKAMAFDKDQVFIGSLNADPRSLWWNSELGLLINSPELGRQLWALAQRGMQPSRSYQVRLSDNDQLVWETLRDGEAVMLQEEPGHFLKKLKAWTIRLLPIEHLL